MVAYHSTEATRGEWNRIIGIHKNWNNAKVIVDEYINSQYADDPTYQSQDELISELVESTGLKAGSLRYSLTHGYYAIFEMLQKKVYTLEELNKKKRQTTIQPIAAGKQRHTNEVGPPTTKSITFLDDTTY